MLVFVLENFKIDIKKLKFDYKLNTIEHIFDFADEGTIGRALFEDKNHYPFVWCVQGLKEDEILSFLDDEWYSILSTLAPLLVAIFNILL